MSKGDDAAISCLPVIEEIPLGGGVTGATGAAFGRVMFAVLGAMELDGAAVSWVAGADEAGGVIAAGFAVAAVVAVLAAFAVVAVLAKPV
jgi:hypothetical protein